MKTTALLIEYLIGGILTLLALLALWISLFCSRAGLEPGELWLKGFTPFDHGVVLAILAAVAYGVGSFAEPIARSCFEWQLDRIKWQRFAKYLHRNRPKLERSPILRDWIRGFTEDKWNRIRDFASGSSRCNPWTDSEENELRAAIGDMRYYVMKQNTALGQDIESLLNRLRLIRILFVDELIVLVATIVYVVRTYDRSVLLAGLFWLCVLFVMGYLTAFAINKRFHRYMRAIERSYKVLVLDA